jgi:hypothetical protein
MKEIVRSFSNRASRTHWWNLISSSSTDFTLCEGRGGRGGGSQEVAVMHMNMERERERDKERERDREREREIKRERETVHHPCYCLMCCDVM